MNANEKILSRVKSVLVEAMDALNALVAISGQSVKLAPSESFPSRSRLAMASKPKSGKPKSGKPKSGKPKSGKPKSGKPDPKRSAAAKRAWSNRTPSEYKAWCANMRRSKSA